MRNPRPTPVTVFGVLDLMFGAWGALTGTLYVSWILGSPSGPNPSLGLLAIVLLQLVPSLVTFGLAYAGIGLLLMRPWGRKLAIALSIIKVTFALLWMGMLAIGFSAMALSSLRAAGVPGASLFRIGIYVGFSAATGLLYPALQVYYLTRPVISAAFVTGVIPATVEEYRDIV